jgi:hypothetical protein
MLTAERQKGSDVMKSKLEKLTAGEIEAVTRKSMRKKKVPLVVSKPTQISLDKTISSKVEVLSAADGIPADKFVNRLLKEDINRLWKKFRRAG